MIHISEIRFDPSDTDHVVAYVHVTLDHALVLHDLRIIRRKDSQTGREELFLAFPSKKKPVHCPSCGVKNPFTNQFCGSCGTRFDGPALLEYEDERGEERLKSHYDIVHPIGPRARRFFERAIIERFLRDHTG